MESNAGQADGFLHFAWGGVNREEIDSPAVQAENVSGSLECLEAAKRLGLARIPAVRVNYGDVSVWSLRKEIKVSQKRVEKAVLKDGTIYPYKTVKHKFPFDVPDIHIPLEELR